MLMPSPSSPSVVFPSHGNHRSPPKHFHDAPSFRRKYSVAYSTYVLVCLVCCFAVFRVITDSHELGVLLFDEIDAGYSDDTSILQESPEVLAPAPFSAVETSPEVAAFDREFRQNLARTSPNLDRVRGMAACLLIKDDNDRLIEWVAYHVAALPLTHLIVGVDPNAVQDPMDVLRRYADAGILAVELWRVDAYCPRCRTDTSVAGHDDRQSVFMDQCVARHKQWGNTWTTLLDTDEYLVFNRYMDPPKWEEKKRRKGVRARQGHEMRFVRGELTANDCHPATSRAEGPPVSRAALPPRGSSLTAMEFLALHADAFPFRGSCVAFPRLFFGGIATDTEDPGRGAPAEFAADAGNFTTLRFRHHAVKGDFAHNRYGKVLVDSSRISLQGTSNVHRPSLTECSVAFPCFDQALFRVQHYLGTYESYSSRKGYVLRSDAKYVEGMEVDMGADDDVRPWLDLFVRKFGERQAGKLVDGVGDVKRAFASVAED